MSIGVGRLHEVMGKCSKRKCRLLGDWRRAGSKLENDPAVLGLELGKALRASMDQIRSSLPQRNLALVGIPFKLF
jgi:hypothetical protein